MGNYINTIATARSLQPVPLTEAVDAKVTQSLTDAEVLVDSYLEEKGVQTVPVTGDAITEQLKIATALMIAADLYCGHGQSDLCKEYKQKAYDALDEYLDTTDLDITTPMSAPTVANYQEEFIEDWNEPNDTVEAMDE
jgi:hypothetical protein